MRLNELEIKLAIGSEDELKKLTNTCVELFGPPIAQFTQLDEYFDTTDGQLKKQDLVIRIRSEGQKRTIAMKSPRVELPSGMTHRIELEFKAEGGEEVRIQLLNQGLQPYEASEKERWTFAYKDCEIVLDRLAFIGSFAEIEGPSEEAINEVVSLLGLSAHKAVRQNYGELIRDRFKTLNLPEKPILATFAMESKLIGVR